MPFPLSSALLDKPLHRYSACHHADNPGVFDIVCAMQAHIDLHTDAPRQVAAVFYNNRSAVDRPGMVGAHGCEGDDGASAVCVGGQACHKPSIDADGNFVAWHPLLPCSRSPCILSEVHFWLE